jgi:hypothetical protein
VYSITDSSGFNGALTATPTILNSTASLTTSTIPATDLGEVYRGLALAPDDGAQPITGLGGTTNYTQGAPAVVVGGSAAFSDASSFNGGSLVVSGGLSGDTFAINNQGTGAGQIGVSGTNVTYGGTQIGTISGGTGTTPLTITFDSVVNTNGAGGTEFAVTSPAVQALLNQVTFSSSGTAGNRTVTFTVNKNSATNLAGAYGTLSAPASDSTSTTQTINVKASTATPPSIATPSNVVVNENSSGTVTVNLTSVASNAGAGDTLTITAVSNNTALTGTPSVTYTSPNTTGSLSFTPVTTAAGSTSVTITVTDTTDGQSAQVQFSVTVAGPPAVTVPAAQTAGKDTNHSISGVSVTDSFVGTSNVQLTLGVADGTLTVNSSVAGGLTSGGISGNGSNSVVLTGSIAAINATLANSTGLVYKGESGFTGGDTLSLLVSDLGNTGSGTPQTTSASVGITVVNAPTVSINTGLATPLGVTTPITSAMLTASATDNTTAQLTYTLTAVPTNGVLKNGTSTLGIGSTFTQASIASGAITYTSASSGSDGFTFTVTDSAGDSTASAVFSPQPARLPSRNPGHSTWAARRRRHRRRGWVRRD